MPSPLSGLPFTRCEPCDCLPLVSTGRVLWDVLVPVCSRDARDSGATENRPAILLRNAHEQ
eukprot:364779-Chlamydomonas_euryale.AAC.16